jgi:hypothetical protein
MGLLDKVKAAAETAATKAKEGVEDVQTKRELGQAYGDLGELVSDLVDSGEIANPKLDELVAKIRGLKEKLAEDAAAAESDGAAADGGDGEAAGAAEAPAETADQA